MDSAEDGEPGQSDARRVKVARVIDEYELEGIGEQLERAWTADGSERKSLRELAAFFNRRVIERAMTEAGRQPIDGEQENILRLLTDDDTTSSERTRIRRRLERDGVDVDGLESDLVSYQAIRTYLKNNRDAHYSASTDNRLERDERSIQQLRNRFEVVAESKLEQLRDSGRIALGDFRLFSDPTVLCEVCGTKLSVSELFDQEGCDCEGT